MRHKTTILLVGLAISSSLTVFALCYRDARIISSNRHCVIFNMMAIDNVKSQWADAYCVKNGHPPPDGTPVPTEELGQYHRGAPGVCMCGGTIWVGKIGEDPSCSFHGSESHPTHRERLFFSEWEPRFSP